MKPTEAQMEFIHRAMKAALLHTIKGRATAVPRTEDAVRDADLLAEWDAETVRALDQVGWSDALLRAYEEEAWALVAAWRRTVS